MEFLFFWKWSQSSQGNLLLSSFIPPSWRSQPLVWVSLIGTYCTLGLLACTWVNAVNLNDTNWTTHWRIQGPHNKINRATVRIDSLPPIALYPLQNRSPKRYWVIWHLFYRSLRISKNLSNISRQDWDIHTALNLYFGTSLLEQRSRCPKPFNFELLPFSFVFVQYLMLELPSGCHLGPFGWN